MEIDVNETKKYAAVWLTNAEKNDAALRERLKPLYRQCKDRNYFVAVFESGEQTLEELTGELLICNRNHAAAREIQKENVPGAVHGLPCDS